MKFQGTLNNHMRVYVDENINSATRKITYRSQEGVDVGLFYCPYIRGHPIPEPIVDIARIDQYRFKFDNSNGLSDHSFNALKWILENTLREEREFSYGTDSNPTIDLWFSTVGLAAIFEKVWVK